MVITQQLVLLKILDTFRMTMDEYPNILTYSIPLAPGVPDEYIQFIEDKVRKSTIMKDMDLVFMSYNAIGEFPEITVRGRKSEKRNHHLTISVSF